MLTGFPSIEVVLLTIWKLMIVLAVVVFLGLLMIRIWRPIRRVVRKLFRPGNRRKVKQRSFNNGPVYTHSANLDKQNFSNV